MAASSSPRSSGSPQSGTLRPHDVVVPGVLVDAIVVAPEQMQTTQTLYDPAISGEIFRPLSIFETPPFDIAKVIARRVAQELREGDAVNIGFGISANVPRILIEEGQHGAVTWVIEQGAVGGVPLLDFQFGCASNAEAIVPRRTSSPISRAAASTCRCCPSSRSTGRLGQRLQARRASACDGGRRRLRRHHRAREEDRLLRLFHRRRRARRRGRRSCESSGRARSRSSSRRSSRSRSRARARSRRARTSPMSPSAA